MSAPPDDHPPPARRWRRLLRSVKSRVAGASLSSSTELPRGHLHPREVPLRPVPGHVPVDREFRPLISRPPLSSGFSAPPRAANLARASTLARSCILRRRRFSCKDQRPGIALGSTLGELLIRPLPLELLRVHPGARGAFHPALFPYPTRPRNQKQICGATAFFLAARSLPRSASRLRTLPLLVC